MSPRAHRLSGAIAVATAVLLAAACGSSGGYSGSNKTAAGGKKSGVTLKILIASSGDAETNALRAAGSVWGAKTGNKVQVTPAKDLNQELSQALAGGTPPDMFYVDAGKFAALQKANALSAYFDQLPNKDDFYPNLVKAFSDASGKAYCAPKDFSTLALEINTDIWTKAGLTDADIPTTWDQLATVAKKLTTKGVTGLVMSDTLDRVDAFMRGAGGTLLNADRSGFDANSTANLSGLQYVQKLAKEGVLKFPKQVDSGWGGEALGKDKAAMTIEGNWIVGGVKTDYPNLKYRVVELPKGPKDKATLSFTQCWGIAQKSANKSAAINFVEYLTSPTQEIAFAKAFGVMPSVKSAQAQFVAQFPDQKAFVAGAPYGVGPTSLAGFDAVQKDFDAKIIGLGTGSSDPKAMLAALQKNATAALKASS